jgi:hypothetical protein
VKSPLTRKWRGVKVTSPGNCVGSPHPGLRRVKATSPRTASRQGNLTPDCVASRQPHPGLRRVKATSPQRRDRRRTAATLSLAYGRGRHTFTGAYGVKLPLMPLSSGVRLPHAVQTGRGISEQLRHPGGAVPVGQNARSRCALGVAIDNRAAAGENRPEDLPAQQRKKRVLEGLSSAGGAAIGVARPIRTGIGLVQELRIAVEAGVVKACRKSRAGPGVRGRRCRAAPSYLPGSSGAP